MPERPRSPHSHGCSEFKEREKVVAATSVELKRLGQTLRATRRKLAFTLEKAAEIVGIHAKYLQRLERGNANATVGTLVAISIAYEVPLWTLFQPLSKYTPSSEKMVLPFHFLDPEDTRPFDNALPLYPLHVAAGAFGGAENAPLDVAPEAWVQPLGKTRPRKGLFITRVVGQSMNRKIPSGAYCVFHTPVEGSRNGRVVLVRHRDIQDPEHGGQFTVKRYESTRKRVGADSWHHVEVRLLPETDDPGFQPIVLRNLREGELTVVAELVEVLPGL